MKYPARPKASVRHAASPLLDLELGGLSVSCRASILFPGGDDPARITREIANRGGLHEMVCFALPLV